MSVGDPAVEARLLNAFRRAAEMPWYRSLLHEQGVDPADVVDLASFTSRCPPLTKRNTFDRFTLGELASGTTLTELAGVLTSSGHGGRFSFGLSTRDQAAGAVGDIDYALDQAFEAGSRSTLAINCLPMGVGFASATMTIATVSVREDMAVALVRALGGAYDQILLVADPLFMKRLLDYAAGAGVDWTGYRVQVVLGEEIFGEQFRSYVAGCLGLRVDRPEQGYIMSSFGIGELGLHLCYETPATIALRRAACASPDLARQLLGVPSAATPVPMLFTFEPLRTLIEVPGADPNGYGPLTISMLDDQLPIPLLRYQTGDVARLLDPADVAGMLRSHGMDLPGPLPANILALMGRDKERLPNGTHVGVYKDALYACPEAAAHFTGAFRLIVAADRCTMHVQLTGAGDVPEAIESRLMDALPADARPDRMVLWPRNRFPFGMTVDYERKFPYYVPGEAFISR
jgi:phenylacetate-CoA ligase